MEYILGFVIVVTAFLQGGYFPTVFLIAGIVFALIFALKVRSKLTTVEIILWGVALLYLIASIVNGYSSASLAQACLTGVCACFLHCYISLSESQKNKLLQMIVLVTGAFAGIALVAFVGVVEISGAVTAHRLQFPFQYANAAGAWYAATILIAQARREKHTSCVMLPITSALFLTRSIGAIGLYFLLQVAVLVYNRKQKGAWKNLILSNAIPLVFSVALFLVSGATALPLIGLLYLAGWHLDRLLHCGQRLYLHWVCVGSGGVGVGAVLLSQRVSSGLQTFAERLSQISDGAKIIAEYPMLGLGAGKWAEVYPYCQSVQYTSTVVHSSVIQIGVDSGIFAIILAVLFCALAWKIKGRSSEMNLAAVLILTHSLLDFTLQFFPICALVLVLLFYGAPAPEKADTSQAICAVAVSICFGLLCVVMLYCEQLNKQLIFCAQYNKWTAVITKYENNRMILGGNPEARSYLVYALYFSGDFNGVLAETEQIYGLGTEELLLRAQSMRNLGDEDSACELLLSELERQMYRVVLFEQVAALLTEWNVDQFYIDAYNQIVDFANQNRTILGTLQGNQVNIDKIS